MGLEIEVGLACTHFHIQHTYIHIAMITPPCSYVGCDISHAAASKPKASARYPSKRAISLPMCIHVYIKVKVSVIIQ